jgi:uncharacterized protein (TIGR02270 family)
MSIEILPEHVVEQLIEDARFQMLRRETLVRAPHVELHRLSRLDDALEASIDALCVSGYRALSSDHGGGPFEMASSCLAASIALRACDNTALHGLISMAGNEAVRVGCVRAFSMHAYSVVAPHVQRMLEESFPGGRLVALAALRAHRAYGPEQMEALGSTLDQCSVKEAMCGLAVSGQVQAVGRIRAFVAYPDSTVSLRAGMACALLGDLGSATLDSFGRTFSAVSEPALLKSLELLAQCHPDSERIEGALRSFAPLLGTKAETLLIRAHGLMGTLGIVESLLEDVRTMRHSRSAGEAFTWITGADLEALGLDRDPPEDFQSGPNDDPNDENVAMDEDEDLPWPDPVKVADWWHKNKHNFQPGVRYFMGKPVTVEHCIHVLKTGKQRQRFIAARYLKLLQPERPLFNCAAPAWRQQALLAKM